MKSSKEENFGKQLLCKQNFSSKLKSFEIKSWSFFFAKDFTIYMFLKQIKSETKFLKSYFTLPRNESTF